MCYVVTFFTGTTKTVCTATSPSPHPWPAACYIGLRDHGVDKVNKPVTLPEIVLEIALAAGRGTITG